MNVDSSSSKREKLWSSQDDEPNQCRSTDADTPQCTMAPAKDVLQSPAAATQRRDEFIQNGSELPALPLAPAAGPPPPQTRAPAPDVSVQYGALTASFRAGIPLACVFAEPTSASDVPLPCYTRDERERVCAETGRDPERTGPVTPDYARVLTAAQRASSARIEQEERAHAHALEAMSDPLVAALVIPGILNGNSWTDIDAAAQCAGGISGVAMSLAGVPPRAETPEVERASPTEGPTSSDPEPPTQEHAAREVPREHHALEDTLPAFPKDNEHEPLRDAPAPTTSHPGVLLLRPLENTPPAFRVENEPSSLSLAAPAPAVSSTDAEAMRVFARLQSLGSRSKFDESQFQSRYRDGLRVDPDDPQHSWYRLRDGQPPAKIPGDWGVDRTLDFFTGPETTSSFRPYFAMLQREGIATEADVRATLAHALPPAGRERSENAVRRELKQAFRNPILDQMATHGDMLRMTRGLNSGDKGVLAEAWYGRQRGLSDGQVTLDRAAMARSGITLMTSRRIDFVDGAKLREVKSIRGPMSERDLDQFADLSKIASSEQGVDLGIRDGRVQRVTEVVYTFLDPEGVKANAEWMTERLKAIQNLSFEIFNEAGQSKVIDRSKIRELEAPTLSAWMKEN